MDSFKKIAKLPIAKELIDMLKYEVYQRISQDEPEKLGRRALALEILNKMGEIEW